MDTSNAELANWIDHALDNPQVIQDLYGGLMYPISEEQILCVLSNHGKHWKSFDQALHVKAEWPGTHPKYDPERPTASAGILGLALIGKYDNDLQLASTAVQRRGREYDRPYQSWADLLHISPVRCLSLVRWYGESVATAHQLATMLCAGRL